MVLATKDEITGRISEALEAHKEAAILHERARTDLQLEAARLEYDRADKLYEGILADYPTSCITLWNRGRLLHDTKRKKMAAEHYSRAVTSPDNEPFAKANALNNLGMIMQGWGRIDQAAGCFHFALKLWPNHVQATSNLGIVKRSLGDYKGADELIRKALILNPKSPEAHCESAFLSLTTGDLARGFREYEWRWKWRDFSTKPLETKKPFWKGQRCDGKTILLTQEQGIGDTLQFVRYAKMVKERSRARVIAFVPKEILTILQYVEGIDALQSAYVIDQENFDYHIPLLSLPRIFGTKLGAIPCEKYLSWEEVEPLDGKFKVGIVWAGRPEHANDRWRSMQIADFAPLFDVDWISWYSIQFGPRASEVAQFPQVKSLTGLLKDFSDTARVLNGLDLLISVDTSVIHLAGGMHRPVWSLIPFSPDWRWMLDRDDSPWYPTMKLFRQTKKGDWTDPIQRIKDDLCKIKILG